MSEIKLSEEQENIINCNNSHLFVNAVSGSGKTSTVLGIANKYPEKEIIQITYNKALKDEVSQKASIYDNLKIYTYHGLAKRYYYDSCFTDQHIKKILNEKMKIRKKPFIDILIIDETQDMLPCYYQLIKKFINDTNPDVQIILLGDHRQSIYNFKGSDSRYLTLSSQLYNKEFKEYKLTTSYRLTNEIGNFVNNHMLQYECIKTNKKGVPVDYYIDDSYKIIPTISKMIIDLIKNNNYKPDDFFIISYSLKNSTNNDSPIKKLERELVKSNINCFFSLNDDMELKDDLIKNKICFTTMHQSKGRERPIVIIFGFDNSFYKFYEKESNPKVCSNILYVACTRAKERLILIHDSRFDYLDFLTDMKNNDYLTIHNNKEIKKEIKTALPRINFRVTDLVKHINNDIMEYIIKLMEDLYETNIDYNYDDLNTDTMIYNKDKKCYEDISDINGVVIPSIYERQLNNNLSTIELSVLENKDCKEIPFVKNIQIPCITIEDWLKIGNVFLSISNNLYARLNQINNYNWLSQDIVDNAIDRFKKLNISENSDYEYEIEIEYQSKFGPLNILGRIDNIDNDNKKIYEFKCVKDISIEHKLQLIIYYWLGSKFDIDYKYYSYVLYNIMTNSYLELKPNDYKIDQIINLLIENKLHKIEKIDDDEFIKINKI